MQGKPQKVNYQPKDQNKDQLEGKKDPQTMSEGQRMGLSKQQLRKLQKRLTAKKKEKEKLEREQQQKKKRQQKKTQLRPKGAANNQNVQIDPQHLQAFRNQKIKLQPNTKLPQQNQQSILITSALPYVNNVPHLGNIIGCVLSADVYSRYKKLQGFNTLYICGTDEYGTATQVKALEESKLQGKHISPKEVCDKYHAEHKSIYEWFDIGFDHFGRTSCDWHTKITQQIFQHVHKQGRISQQQMTQCYCESCDLFLADRLIFGTCPHCGYEDARGDQCDKCQKLINDPTELVNYRCNICKKAPVVKNTRHLFIELPAIQEELQKWVEKASKEGEWSQNSITITKGWLKTGLRPKCITRDLKWGVPVPLEGFEKKVFYVWFDAPIGYLSITADFLGEDYRKWWANPLAKLYQFMGKDNVPFHTVIFPSSLIASRQGWTLLHHISTTEYLNYQSGKFSKSRGTGVFGDQARLLQKQIPSEVWRYYLLVNRPQKSDSEFSWKDFINKNNNELLANLGNLVHRTLQFIFSNYNKAIPKLIKLQQLDEIFLKEIQDLYIHYKQTLDKVEIKQGLKICMEISSRGNKYLQQTRFWQQDKRESNRTDTVMNIMTNFIRFQSFIIEPFMPSTSAKINYMLGLEDYTTSEHDRILGKVLNSDFQNVFRELTIKSQGIKQPIPLFVKYGEAEENTWRDRFKGKSE